MRIAYLDCFAGVAGDMMLGALIDAGVPADVLYQATAALNIGATLRIERVDRSGISCTKVHVLDAGELAEASPHTHEHTHPHPHDHGMVPHQTDAAADMGYSRQPLTQHLHKTGHTHSHEAEHSHEHAQGHAHVHGRSLTVIRTLISAAPLEEPVKNLAIKTFELLGASEAKIHNVPIDDIHFHEVGAVDAIVDIVAASAGLHHLQIGKWFCSPLNVGGGMVECAHGTFPVPAPATADLLRNVPTYSAHLQKELVTPTGAALLRALEPEFGPQPPMRVSSIGYGAGTRNPPGFPNVLRLSIGEQTEPQPQSSLDQETVTVLEAALDDLSPQVLAFVAEKALEFGALDVMLSPVTMKKGRPGTLLTLLCKPADAAAFQQLLFRETSTLGLRIREDRRAVLTRTYVTVNTPYGSIRIKTGSEHGEERNLAPEFEDCRAAAQRHGVPLKQVQQAAIATYLRTR